MYVATTPPALQKAALTMKATLPSGKATCFIFKAIHVAHGIPKATRKKTSIATVGLGRLIPVLSSSAPFRETI
jgi:hypothetical protein